LKIKQETNGSAHIMGEFTNIITSESRMVYYDLIRMGVASNAVSCITEDSQGRIWIGTWGGGIAVFDRENFRKFNTEMA